MAITSKSEDKYAYLFTSDVSERYLNDLEKVYNTIRDYYSYPDANIWLVFASAALPDLTAFPGLDGAAVKKTVSSVSAMLDTFEDSTEGLFHKVLNEPGSGAGKKSVLIYFTGAGHDGSITVAAGEDIDSAWLETRLGFTLLDPGPPPIPISMNEKCQINVLMQQPHGESFQNCVSAIADNTFTYACAQGEASPGGTSTGSYFTTGWVSALRFEQLGAVAANYPGKYADEIDLAEGSLHIAMDQACKYAVDYCQENGLASGSTPNSNKLGDDPYLGLPMLHILDGDEDTPPQSWWESPDIWLSCPGYYSAEGNDYYVYDEVNTIHIRVNAGGCHPVRLIYIGSKVFRSGGGGTGEVHTGTHTPAAVLKPGENSTYTYTYFYHSGFAHSCIKSRAALELIADADIDDLDSGGLAVNEWDPHSRDNEAQRNTDPSGLKSSSGGAGADPGEGKADEEAPEGDAEPDTDNPETDTDTKSTKNLRAYKEHVYIIRNTFRGKRDFRYLIDPALLKDTKRFLARWFALDPRNPERMKELRPVAEPVPHIPLLLGSGRELHILNYIGLNKGIKPDKPLRFKFDIQVGTKCVMKFLGLRLRGLKRMPFMSWSGVTMIVSDGSFTLKGIVRSGDRKLLDKIFVIAETIDGRQSAAATVDEKGTFIFSEINPDIYRVWARCGKLTSKKIIVHGQPLDKKSKKRPVIVDLG